VWIHGQNKTECDTEQGETDLHLCPDKCEIMKLRHDTTRWDFPGAVFIPKIQNTMYTLTRETHKINVGNT
jgi:hypothetical protein